MMKRYDVIKEYDLDKLIEAVDSKMISGWKPIGGIQISFHELKRDEWDRGFYPKSVFLQSIVFEED